MIWITSLTLLHYMHYYYYYTIITILPHFVCMYVRASGRDYEAEPINVLHSF